MVAFIHGMSITDQEAASNVGAEQRLRFAAPQDPIEVVTLSSTRIASAYHQVRVGGDLAALKRIMKAVFTLDAESLIGEEPGVLDRAFISEHTTGIDSLKADIEATTWDETVSASGMSQAAIESAAEVYAHEKNVIVCYGMGVTQRALGTSNVQQITNLLMLRGKIGRQRRRNCSDSRHHREPRQGTPQRHGTGFRFPAPRGQGTQRGSGHGGHHRGRVKGIDLPRRKSSGRDVGSQGYLCGNDKARSCCPHRNEAESPPPPRREDIPYPALP